ncbi:MAG: hypothetical protein Q7R47_02165 [Candidatus Diapherotrites archaeon]|nr:hypothetical protein [Candidatus Diapherotrites archaeon]
MPFTPFHLGPALAIGIAFRKWLHIPTFLIANIIIDIEPFLVIFGGLDGPVHGLTHTFLGALVIGTLLAIAIKPIAARIEPAMKKIRLGSSTAFSAIGISAVGGIALHVVLDSVLYTDIQPFFPLQANPLLGLLSFDAVYGLCVVLGIIGIVLYGLSLNRNEP